MIQQAGGFTANVDGNEVVQKLNLAAIIEDQQHVFVPASRTTQAQPQPQSSGNLVSINKASVAELDTLPGIGPALAAKIIAARPFARLEDLANVSGISDAILTKLIGLIEL